MPWGHHPEPFADRTEAGRALAPLVAAAIGRLHRPPAPDRVLVLGLPRGGVPVAAEVAGALAGEFDARLDVLLVRKIGVPGQPELAMGAVAAIGDAVDVVRNDALIGRLGVPDEAFRAVLDREMVELRRRAAAYRGDRPDPRVRERVVVVVDDGLATGATMRAAAAAVRRQAASAVIVATPVGAPDTCERLRGEVDDLVCARHPRPFRAVHQGYADFRPTTDDEVLAALAYDRRG